MRAVHPSRILRPWRESWYVLALLLVLAIGVHQFVMASPSLHEQVMPMPAMAIGQLVGKTGEDGNTCPAPCVCTCPTVVAAFPLTAIAALALFAVIAAVGVVYVRASVSARSPNWWPPERCRALLHVFLC